jgi:hypothetical protein
MPYDVVHRDPRFDLANVSYLHNGPSGHPAAAGSLALLRRAVARLVWKWTGAGEAGVQGFSHAQVVAMKVHLLLQFRMVLKEKCCIN